MSRILITFVALLLVAAPLIADDHGGMCTSPPPENDPEATCGGATDVPHTDEPSPTDVDDDDQQQQPDDVIPEPLSYFVDITATIGPGLPLWDSPSGWKPKEHLSLEMNMSNGDPCYVSKLNMNVHTGTHIDMPSHFLSQEYDQGNFAHKADLGVLIGPALLMAVPSQFPGPGGQGVMEVGNISVGVLKEMLLIDKQEGLERLILKTDSTVKKLMSKRKFEASYTGLTLDAAKYIVEHTDIKLIGIDYLSIAAYKDMAETHKVLLDKGIVIVEGLNLEEASEGWHNLVCLPLKLARVEGAPARCILTAAPSEYWTKHRNKAPVDMGDWTPWDFANTDE